MLQILRSRATTANPDFKNVPRTTPAESNVKWLERNDPGGVRVVMFGGLDHVSFRLRVAQSQARHDMSPSAWSHAALLIKADAKLGDAGTELHHVAVDPAKPFASLIKTNGIDHVKLAPFDDPKAFPNVAVLGLQADADALGAVIAELEQQRPIVDHIELSLGWLAFICGVGRAGNPLHDGVGIPSAVMIENALAGVGYELTPGLANRASCPEGIWQAAKWWHGFHANGAIKGAWVTDDKLGE